MEPKTLRLKTGPKPENKFRVPDQKRILQPHASNPATGTEEKRQMVEKTLRDYAETLDITPVRSNAELKQRGREYFLFCAERRLVPTVEGLASFCGYSAMQLRRWEHGQSGGFSDGLENTSAIVERLKALIDAVDGELSSTGVINPVCWIFRRKAVSNWVESSRLEIVSGNGNEISPPLSPEEIARRLPDPDADYSVNDADSQA